MSDPKRLTITMAVDPKNLNQKNVEEHVSFSDDVEPARNGNPKNFTSKVKKNQKILWKGQVLEPDGKDERVEILEVKRKTIDGGAELLKHTKPKNDGTVEGKIKDKDMKGVEKYDVHFRINGTVYVVDPKLEMEMPPVRE
ncbi:MAG: hypothetical protein WBL27_06765 [Salinimicrobium sp.]